MHDEHRNRPRDLTTALKQPMRVLRDAVATVEGGLAGDVQLRAITASLITTWHMIERDPGFEVAAADLLGAARQLASRVPAAAPARLLRLLRESQARVDERLASARMATDRSRTDAAPSMIESAPCEPQSASASSLRESESARSHVGAVLGDLATPEDDAAEIAAFARALAPRMAA